MAGDALGDVNGLSACGGIFVHYDCGDWVGCGAASGGCGTCECAGEPKYYCAGDAVAEKSEAPYVQQSRARTRIGPAPAVRCPFRPVLLSAFGERRTLEPPHPSYADDGALVEAYSSRRANIRAAAAGRLVGLRLTDRKKEKLSLPAICQRVSDRNQRSLTDVQAYLQAYL